MKRRLSTAKRQVALLETANERRKVPIRLNVYIQPRASKTEFAGTHDGSIKIRIASPPVDNAANRVLVEFVAERLGIAKYRVRIVSGSTSRRKVLEIDDITASDISAAFPC